MKNLANSEGIMPFSHVLLGRSEKERHEIYEDNYYTLKEKERKEKRFGLTIEQISHIVNAIYIYDKTGKTIELHSPLVGKSKVFAELGGRRFSYWFRDLGVMFFTTKEECDKKAADYLARVRQFVPLRVLKKIVRLKYGDKLYQLDKSGKINEYEIDDDHWFDRQSLTLNNTWDIDDDYGGRYYTDVFPLADYGKTWAFSKEELESHEREEKQCQKRN